MAWVHGLTGFCLVAGALAAAGLDRQTTAPAFIDLPGGQFTIGSEDYYPEEAPIQRMDVAPFSISTHEVTNAQFAEFVAATGYVTSAERLTEIGFPANGSAVFEPGGWRFAEGAEWRHPEGPGSSIEGREDDPVVQVSLEDVKSYADWRCERLPTEAEWEFAARGGLDGRAFAWGDVFTPAGTHMANTWQGMFPFEDDGSDGHMGRAPVGSYPPNGFEIYDIIGNVWEWTSDPYYPDRRFEPPEGVENTGFDPRQPENPVGVLKGGSFLCAPDFCGRYRPAARHAQDTGLGTNHIGFRTVKSTCEPGIAD